MKLNINEKKEGFSTCFVFAPIRVTSSDTKLHRDRSVSPNTGSPLTRRLGATTVPDLFEVRYTPHVFFLIYRNSILCVKMFKSKRV